MLGGFWNLVVRHQFEWRLMADPSQSDLIRERLLSRSLTILHSERWDGRWSRERNVPMATLTAT
jgi:hypothetical protein